ncbi:hypothetical protein KP509_08G003200 [Ceratopteris richardii]|uniref:Uncharacterized protein n=1 Tax=Ceratopteris richardii TaxID=49495 RepID=A0A8T2U7K1_CERRI|nr:hypothetical protein KP509_08G003200 [Ceratopteris richardii]
MFPATASPKVEPVDDHRWDGASHIPMMPTLDDGKPVSLNTPLLSADTGKPLNSRTDLKSGNPLKSSLKGIQKNIVPSLHSTEGNERMATLRHHVAEPRTKSSERRSIKWSDDFGKELFEIKEFEKSDSEDSDEESTTTSCSCIIQ